MAAAPEPPSVGDPFGDVLSDLILASEHLHPDAIPDLVAQTAARLGGRHVSLLLVDLAQVVLSPLDQRGDLEPQSVDGTPAGEAFRTQSPVIVPGDGEVRVWLPLMDSADRTGALGVTVDDVDPATLRRWRTLTSYLGELLVSKSPYGDSITLARRTRPTSLAAELRWAMLPPLTFVSPAVTVSAIVEPAYQIAGDTFDYAVNGSLVHLALLDAMGHGLEASRMANLAVTSYRHSRRSTSDLGATAVAMDEVISEQFGPNKFVTGQLATLDTESGLFRLLNLGHPRPLLLRDRTVVGQLECRPGSPVGLGWAPSPMTAETQLRPGDMVLLHTDGITEARAETPEEFGQERFESLVGELLAAGVLPAELLRRVVHEVLAFQRFRPRDDATLLLVGWRVS